MKKRTLSLLMAASMTAGLLAGCGSSKPAETTAAPTTAAATTAAENKGRRDHNCGRNKRRSNPCYLKYCLHAKLWKPLVH